MINYGSGRSATYCVTGAVDWLIETWQLQANGWLIVVHGGRNVLGVSSHGLRSTVHFWEAAGPAGIITWLCFSVSTGCSFSCWERNLTPLLLACPLVGQFCGSKGMHIIQHTSCGLPRADWKTDGKAWVPLSKAARAMAVGNCMMNDSS